MSVDIYYTAHLELLSGIPHDTDAHWRPWPWTDSEWKPCLYTRHQSSNCDCVVYARNWSLDNTVRTIQMLLVSLRLDSFRCLRAWLMETRPNLTDPGQHYFTIGEESGMLLQLASDIHSLAPLLRSRISNSALLAARDQDCSFLYRPEYIKCVDDIPVLPLRFVFEYQRQRRYAEQNDHYKPSYLYTSSRSRQTSYTM